MSEDKKKNLLYILLDVMSRIITITAVTLILLVGYDYIRPDPLSIEHVSQQNKPITVEVGESFNFSRRLCVEEDTVVEVHRELRNKNTNVTYLLGNITYATIGRTEECFNVTLTTFIPKDVEPGAYTYNTRMFYKIGLTRKVNRPSEEVNLTIVDKNTAE